MWGKFYTELFFLDEPTAFAAGHRPCFECRRQAANAFRAAFPGRPPGVEAMDQALHRERVDGRRKRLWRARLGDLPDGAMIAREGRAYALRDGTLFPWSFAGYGAPARFDLDWGADVLTRPRPSRRSRTVIVRYGRSRSGAPRMGDGYRSEAVVGFCSPRSRLLTAQAAMAGEVTGDWLGEDGAAKIRSRPAGARRSAARWPGSATREARGKSASSCSST